MIKKYGETIVIVSMVVLFFLVAWQLLGQKEVPTLPHGEIIVTVPNEDFPDPDVGGGQDLNQISEPMNYDAIIKDVIEIEELPEALWQDEYLVEFIPAGEYADVLVHLSVPTISQGRLFLVWGENVDDELPYLAGEVYSRVDGLPQYRSVQVLQ